MADHSIVHLEIPTKDPEASATFYHDVFGWKIETNPVYKYVTFLSEGGTRGGFAGPSEPTYKAGEPLVYLSTDNIDATLATVEAHGGKMLLPKTEIPGVGVWAVFTDPNGNRFGLFTRKAQ